MTTALTTNVLRELTRLANRPCCPQTPYPVTETNGQQLEYDGAAYLDPALCQAGARYINVLDNFLGETSLPAQMFSLAVALSLVMVGKPQWAIKTILSLAATSWSSTPELSVMQTWLQANRTGILSDITLNTDSASAKTAIDIRISNSSLSSVNKLFMTTLFGLGGLNNVYALYDFPPSDISWAGCPGDATSVYFQMVNGKILVGAADTFEAVPGYWLFQGVDRSVFFDIPAVYGSVQLSATITGAGVANELYTINNDGTLSLIGTFDMSIPNIGLNWDVDPLQAVGVKLVRPSGGQKIKISSIRISNELLT